MPNRNEGFTVTSEDGMNPNVESATQMWAEPMAGEIPLEDAAPVALDAVFQNFAEREQKIKESDARERLTEDEINEKVEKKLKEDYQNLKPEGRERIRRGLLKKEHDEQVTSSQLIAQLKKNPEQALRLTNNFYMVFDPKLIQQSLERKPINPIKLPYLALPHYLNKKYNNAWSRMCQNLDKEVEIVMGFAGKNRNERLPEDKDSVDAALTSIVLYPEEAEGISLYLLRP
ncbi:MAG: hypothetical protein EXS48_03380 [Candidatus Staskawiczbacteria bacterium]|nr:hypothetical protein [Candidatus Staskawiczbacteria bacterium]